MKKIFYTLSVLLASTVPAFVFAASPFLKPVKDVLGDVTIFINFLSWALPAIGLLVFFILVIAYIMMKMQWNVIPGMDVTKVNGKGLFWSIVALACMFAVYGLIQLVGALFGIDTNRSKTITAPSLPQVGGVSGSSYYGN